MDKEAIQTFSYRITQANRTQLIVIMYDMVLQYLQDAQSAKAVLKKEAYTENIRLAKRVIDRLSYNLDMQYEISSDLFQIYLIMQSYLVKAECNMSQEHDQYLDTVVRIAEKLRGAWYEVSLSDTSKPLMRNTQQVYSGLTYSSGGNSNEVSKDYDVNRGYKA